MDNAARESVKREGPYKVSTIEWYRLQGKRWVFDLFIFFFLPIYPCKRYPLEILKRSIRNWFSIHVSFYFFLYYYFKFGT